MRILVLLVSLLSVGRLVDCDTLKALFVIQRHGDRAPNEQAFPPNDPYHNKTYWPNGFSQLTDRGRTRMLGVGRFLRQQYGHFLTDDLREVNLMSSAADRCQATGKFTVNGAYPADQTNEIRPVPIRVDSKMLMYGSCAIFKSKIQQVLESDEIRRIETAYQPLYDYLTRQTGVKVDHHKSDCFYHTISCEISEGLAVSRWATRSIVDQMADLKSKTFSWMVHTKQLKRLAIGLFLNELTEKLQNFGNDLEPPKKLNLYVTHDSLITALLVSLGVDNELPPPFGATVIFELHGASESNPETESENVGGSNSLNSTESDGTLSNSSNSSNRSAFNSRASTSSAPNSRAPNSRVPNPNELNSIKIFYLNETQSGRPYRLQMADCPDPCTVERFVSFIAPLAVRRDEYETECKLDASKNAHWNRTFLVKVAAVIAGVVLVASAIIALRKRQMNSQTKDKQMLV